MKAVFAVAASTLVFVHAEGDALTSQTLHDTAKALAHRPVDQAAVAKIKESTGLDEEQFEELVLDYLEEIIIDLPGKMFAQATQYALKEKIAEADLSEAVRLRTSMELNELVAKLQKIDDALEVPEEKRRRFIGIGSAALICGMTGCHRNFPWWG